MMSGRNTIGPAGMVAQVRMGVAWLNEQFGPKGVEFATAIDEKACEVLLRVFKRPEIKPHGHAERLKIGTIAREKAVFEVVEPVKYFVSRTTVTKLILIAG